MIEEQIQTDESLDAFTPTRKKNLRIWGRIDYNEWLCGFTMPVKDALGNTITKGEKSPYNPEIHKSAALAIDLFIQPLPEVEISNSRVCEFRVTKGSIQWDKETLPTLMALGVTAKEQINNAWALIEIIESKKTYKAGDGEIKHNLSWAFIKLFADEDACRSDCLAAGGQSSNGQNAPINTPVATPEEKEKEVQYKFLEAIVTAAARGKTLAQAKKEVAKAITAYPTVAKYFNVDSLETVELIKQIVEA